MLTETQALELVDRTWQEVGYKVRPLHRTVVVRTLPTEDRIGLIWKPPSLQGLYGGMAHQVLVKAVVMRAGPGATVKPGEVVTFTRLYFGHWKKFEDGTYFGWIDNAQIAGYPEED